ncbi:MAG: energy-coupling factor transporter ATPase [Eubacteriales bacterium]|nr:energy-coupling factor transporter ATPase [Eubacteriales bacterium]MDD4476448.1 energy-coupling factor transporter ATPase [Eubacteriales bacterium]
MNFIEAENLKFSYDGTNNVVDIPKLFIEKGKHTAILGHNGSGKSTLAKLLSGILLPTSGKVVVNSYDTTDESKFYDIRKSCGMVFQNPDNQIVASVVEEDVAFAPENLGIIPVRIREIVEECLFAVNMTEYSRHSTYKLSGGQKQRVAIAGILAMQPECVFFDEATAMLDPIGRKEIMSAVDRLNKELGITVVSITHYMNEAVEADRVIVMNKGEIVMDGDPVSVFSMPEELQGYGLALPQVTELFYHLEKDGYKLPRGVLHTMQAADAIENYVKGKNDARS